MKESIFVSASVVSYNSRAKTLDTVNSLLANTKPDGFRLYVIDNGSCDGTAEALKSRQDLTFIENGENIGFGAAHNKILGLAHGKYHAVVNPDIILNSDVIGRLADILEENPDIVMITPKILNPDGSEQKLPKKNPTLRYLFLGRLAGLGGIFQKIRDEYIMADKELSELTDIEFCTGCFFVIRSDVFEKLGGFDERYFMYLEDADLAREAKKYGRVVFCPQYSVTHFWERTSAKNPKYLLIHIISCIKYLRKWRKRKS